MISAVEALTNAVVGLLVSWGVTYWCLPFWGLAPSAGSGADCRKAACPSRRYARQSAG